MLNSVTAKDVMTRDVLVARSDWSLHRLSEFFVEYAITGAPVTDKEGNLLGVVSTTDLVRFRAVHVKNPLPVGPHRFYLEPMDTGPSAQEINVMDEGGGDGEAAVKDIMTYAVFNVDEGATLAAVIDAMVGGNIHRVFVTREDQLVGIITAHGLLEYFAQSRCFSDEPE